MSTTYIFMDESGDLGFDLTKKGTSKHFIVTMLFAQNHRKVEKMVSKTHATLRRKNKARSAILHAYKATPTTRHRLLKLLAHDSVSIMSICVNKKKVFTNLHDEKNTLYNYVVNILLDRIYTKKLLPTESKIILVASKKDTNKFLNQNFKDYLESSRSSHKLQIEVEIKSVHQNKCLQAVDFASWAIFRKYEHQDIDYYNDIKKVIVEENWLYGSQ